MTKAIDSALPLNVGREVLLITNLRWWWNWWNLRIYWRNWQIVIY